MVRFVRCPVYYLADAEDKQSIMQEWEEHMSDFVPADMITFE